MNFFPLSFLETEEIAPLLIFFFEAITYCFVLGFSIFCMMQFYQFYPSCHNISLILIGVRFYNIHLHWTKFILFLLDRSDSCPYNLTNNYSVIVKLYLALVYVNLSNITKGRGNNFLEDAGGLSEEHMQLTRMSALVRARTMTPQPQVPGPAIFIFYEANPFFNQFWDRMLSPNNPVSKLHK